ncbi:hypothetical protein ACS0TY_033865 [Phlomoides rotata]
MIILSWNANGLGNDHTKNALRFYCRTYHPDWVAIFEPKVRFSTIHINFWRGLNLSFYTENARNNLRPNIWLFCKSEHFDNSRILHSSDQCILLETSASSNTWCFGFVHARTTYTLRRELWTDISAHANRSLCIMGDFNVVLGAHERSGVLVTLPAPLRNILPSSMRPSFMMWKPQDLSLLGSLAAPTMVTWLPVLTESWLMMHLLIFGTPSQPQSCLASPRTITPYS